MVGASYRALEHVEVIAGPRRLARSELGGQPTKQYPSNSSFRVDPATKKALAVSKADN
jgi:hypothetical protein